MTSRYPFSEEEIARQLRTALGTPSKAAISRSRAHTTKWFTAESSLIRWGEMNSPLGRLFAAVNPQGLCAIDFGRPEAEFLRRFDRRVRLEKNSPAVAVIMTQLREYFAGRRVRFRLRVDLSQLTPFQRQVLDAARRIVPGQVLTYHEVAQRLGRPRSSRPVGQALARNPIPIVIPCHRVIASDGSLGGYSGGSGLRDKRWLLKLEGARY